MKKAFLYIALFILSAVTSSIKGQCDDAIGGFLSTNDSVRCVGELTKLELSGYQGRIEWQAASISMDNWTTITSDTSDQLTVYPTNDTVFRAYLNAETGCNDDSSTTLFIDVLDTLFTDAVGFSDEPCGNIFMLSAEGSNPGVWSKKSGPGNDFYNPGNTSPTVEVSVTEYGEYVFAFTNASGGCAAVNIKTFQQNKAVASNDIRYCGGFREPFHIESSLSNPEATGYWTRIGTNYAISDINDTNTLITPDFEGLFTIQWTEELGDCTHDTIVTFGTYVQPDAVINPFAPTCDSTGSFSAQSVLRYTDQYWSAAMSVGKLIFSDSTTLNTNVIVDTYDTYEVYWTVENSYCTDTDTLQAAFYEQPVASAGIANDLCGDTANMIASPSVSGAIGQWRQYTGQSTAEIEDANSPTTWIYNNSIYGQYAFIWEETNEICVDSDTVTFDFVKIPEVDAGAPDSICGQNTTLEANLDLGTGEWFFITGPIAPNITSTTNPNSAISVNDYGVYTLRWIETNQICQDSADVQLSFFQQPIASAGAGGDTCGLGFSLDAVKDVNGSTGIWEQQSGPGFSDFSDELNAQSDVLVSEAGDYRFVWKEINVLCADTNSVGVTFKPQPIADAGSGGLSCENTFQLNALPTTDQGQWIIESDDGTLNFFPSEIAPDALITSSDTGRKFISWVVDNGSCTGSSTIEIQFNEQPVVRTDFENAYCGNSANLNATSTIGVPTWSKISGPGNAEFTTKDTPVTEIEVDEYGIYQLVAVVNNKGCFDSAQVVTEFIEQPMANAGEDAVVCGKSYVLQAVPSIGEGTWRFINGPASPTYAPDMEDPEAEVTISDFGIYTFVRSEVNGQCTDRDTIVLTFIRKPIADAGPDQELDNKFETGMAATAPGNGESGTWILIAGNGFIDDPQSPVSEISALELGESIFLWEVDNGDCKASDSVSIFVFDIFIPEVITPNNDGNNDVFFVKGIEDIPNVELTVMNRWGLEVYYSSDYDNSWGGTNKSGADLTNDTYFYVLRVDVTRIIKGFVVIKR